MSSRKEELLELIESLNSQINELRQSGKGAKNTKEKNRLVKLMTELIIELDSLKEPNDE